jgi:quercetin 2,3-dioxygenase
MTAPAPAPGVDVRRAAERFSTRTTWLDSRHSFSFGGHYDPANTRHGLLLAHNDDRVQPGPGFVEHPHRDLEIVTWVVQGSLVHRDSTGASGVVHPGRVQRLSAGRGVLHSESNDAYRLHEDRRAEPVHYVQMWVVPEEPGGDPAYEQLDVADELGAGRLVTVASGRSAAGLRLRNRDAALHAARLRSGQSVRLPEAPWLHLFVPTGAVELEGAGALRAGDAVRFTATGGHRVVAVEPAEVLVWEMHARPPG